MQQSINSYRTFTEWSINQNAKGQIDLHLSELNARTALYVHAVDAQSNFSIQSINSQYEQRIITDRWSKYKNNIPVKLLLLLTVFIDSVQTVLTYDVTNAITSSQENSINIYMLKDINGESLKDIESTIVMSEDHINCAFVYTTMSLTHYKSNRLSLFLKCDDTISDANSN